MWNMPNKKEMKELEKWLDKRKSEIASSDKYKEIDFAKILIEKIGSIWEDTLAENIETTNVANGPKIAESGLLTALQNVVKYSSINGSEGFFYLKINNKYRFFGAKVLFAYQSLSGNPKKHMFQIRKTYGLNVIQDELIVSFDYESKSWKIMKVNSDTIKTAKTTKQIEEKSLEFSDAELSVLELSKDKFSFTGQPSHIFTNNAQAKSDLEGFEEMLGVVSYLFNEVPADHDYERLKFEFNLMFNSELDKKTEDKNMRNRRVDTKVNQDERYSTATGVIQPQSTVLNTQEIAEKWLELLQSLTKTPSFTGGITGGNNKQTTEVVGADPIATAYAFKKLAFFNNQLLSYLSKNKSIETFLGLGTKFKPSKLLELKQKFIEEGVTSASERKEDITSTQKDPDSEGESK